MIYTLYIYDVLAHCNVILCLVGLCRTAEIFGVSEMVVNSLKITEDANFLSTSVTAHQWIPLKQVPVDFSHTLCPSKLCPPPNTTDLSL